MQSLILDSNIIIYSIDPEYQSLREYLLNVDMHVSEISKLEVLGYSKLTTEENQKFEYFFANLTTLINIQSDIINQAIQLRKIRKMSLGDSIIASTALLYQLPILTRNEKDFAWINELTVINPFA